MECVQTGWCTSGVQPTLGRRMLECDSADKLFLAAAGDSRLSQPDAGCHHLQAMLWSSAKRPDGCVTIPG